MTAEFIEVERRALLTPTQRVEMLCFMSSRPDIRKMSRVIVDFSKIEGRTETRMLRIDDGRQEVVVKSGSLTDAVRREQLPRYPDTPLETTLGGFARAGYMSAMVGRRNMHVATVPGLNYSLRDVIPFYDPTITASTLLEIESARVMEGSEHLALTRLDNEFASHGLDVLTDEEFTNWVVNTYANDDQAFSYSPEAASTLAIALRAEGRLTDVA
jgi:hypothetical protein